MSPTRPSAHRLIPPARDSLLAGALWLVDLITFQGVLDRGFRPGEAFFSLLGFLPLCWRRRAPLTVLALVVAHLLASAVWFPEAVPLLSVVLALYTVGALVPGRAGVVAAAIGWAATTAVPLQRELTAEQNVTENRAAIVVLVLFLFSSVCWGSWLIGRRSRLSRTRIRDLEDRRAAAAAEAVAHERRRIAAELHDIVSHSVSVMVLQAAGARRMLDLQPARTAEALANIEEVGKESMGELRRLLGVLRDGQFVEGDAYTGLQPGLKDLRHYIDTVRQSGLSVRLSVEGEPAQLDPSVDLSAYRIVKEALTNSTKYAGDGASADVRLVWTSQELQLEISDDGSVPPQDALGTGNGLIGLIERARAVGGHLEAGPNDAGGFRVHATLPVAERGLRSRGARGARDAVQPTRSDTSPPEPGAA
jgi:signal transduction histidine kinase